MALLHTSTLSDSEPSWSTVDKNRLPRNAHADMGDADKKSSWRYPHHHVKSGSIGGKHSIYVKGDMYLHRGGLKAALQAAGGARSGQKEKNAAVKRHLSHHADVIGMSKKETATLLGMSVASLIFFLENDNNISTKQIGGENTMAMTYEELEAKVKTLEASIAEKDNAIATMKTDAEALASTVKTNAESLESEIAKYEKSEGELADKVDGLEKDAKGNKIFIEAGKNAIEDMKAEIHKMNAQVDGKDYNKDLVDKQLGAFGTDVEALTQFKVSLEARRAKMFKSGEINPDEKKSTKTTEQDDYALGQSIGKGNVIPIIKNT